MANINLNTTSGLKFQQPNIQPGRTAMEGLVSGIGPTLQSIPSLMLQYQQLKQDRERAGLAHDISVAELKRRGQEDAFTQAAQRVKQQIELLNLGRSQVSISPTGEKTEFPGLTGWEVILDENGLPSLRQRGDENPSPGVSRVIGSPGQSAINVPKSEFLKSPEKYREMGKLKIVDDTGLNAGPDGKKQLPPAEVRNLTEGASVLRMLPDIGATIEQNADIFGPIKGRIFSKNPYSERGQTIQAKVRSVSQAFGRFMEGGVLRKEDEEKYYKMFPQMSDKPEVARNKLKNVSEILARQYEDKKNALGASGHDISGLIDASNAGGGMADGAPVSPTDNIPIISSQEQYDALPSGTNYLGPDGTPHRKK